MPAPKPKPKREPAKTITWQEFEVGLSEQTRTFLALVQSRTRVTMKTVSEALSLPGKALGGITGAFARKAARYGFEVPYTQAKSPTGQRMWIWRPSVAKKLGISADVAEPPAEPEPEAPARTKTFLRKATPETTTQKGDAAADEKEG